MNYYILSKTWLDDNNICTDAWPYIQATDQIRIPLTKESDTILSVYLLHGHGLSSPVKNLDRIIYPQHE